MSQRAVRRIVINGTGAADVALFTPRSDQIVRVLDYQLVADGAGTARFESGTGGTALTGIMPFVANGNLHIWAPFNENGWFETAVGAILSLEIGGSIDVDGHMNVELVQGRG